MAGLEQVTCATRFLVVHTATHTHAHTRTHTHTYTHAPPTLCALGGRELFLAGLLIQPDVARLRPLVEDVDGEQAAVLRRRVLCGVSVHGVVGVGWVAYGMGGCAWWLSGGVGVHGGMGHTWMAMRMECDGPKGHQALIHTLTLSLTRRPAQGHRAHALFGHRGRAS